MKKSIVILEILAISTFFLVGCSSGEVFKGSQEKSESRFYMTEKESEDLYTIGEKNEKSKVSSEDGEIKYIDSLDIYLTIDGKGDLYSINNKFEKNKIASELEGLDDVFVDGKIMYYKNEKNNLYMIEEGKEQVLLASSVSGMFRVKKDKVIYVDGDGNIYEKSPNSDDKHIVSGALYFELSSDWENIIYSTPNGIYYKNIESGKEEKVANDYTGAGVFNFLNKDEIIFLEDYSLETKTGNLVVKKIGEEKKSVIEDVSSFEIVKNNIYYIDSNSALHIKKKNEEQTKKISDDIYDMKSDGENIYVSNNNQTLYKINDDEKQEINTSVKQYDISKKAVVYLTNNNTLYIGSEKISDNATKYITNVDDVAYLTSDDKIYIYDGKKSKVVFENANEYDRVKFMQDVLFEGAFSANDLNGYWQSEGKNGQKIFLNFEEDNELEVFTVDGECGETKVGFSNKTEDSMTMHVQHLNINILKFDDDTIILGGDVVKRIDRKTYIESTKNINK